MYMRNNRYNKHSKYNLDGLPPNYSGQFTEENLGRDVGETMPPKNTGHLHDDLHEKKEHKEHDVHREHDGHREHKEVGEIKEKRDGSLLGHLFGGDKGKDGKKGGLLSGLFNKGDNKDGGILSNIELEDLILLAVIFFLLKDGFEDDLIIILAIILFSS